MNRLAPVVPLTVIITLRVCLATLALVSVWTLPSFSSGQSPSSSVEIRLETEAGAPVFRVVGWSESNRASSLDTLEWHELLAVFVEGSALGVPPILGSYAVENDALVFRPRFPLSPGLKYRASFSPRVLGLSERDDRVVAFFEIPRLETESSTIVDHVYPTSSVLPENQLKLYLQFSAPMSRGEAYERIHLLDVETGEEVALPFLELEQELWNRDFTRFTILFDPGRIKTGLVPNIEAGRAIEKGKTYSLVIDREWLDATGLPLMTEHRKTFTGGPFDDVAPDLETWKMAPPESNTFAAFTVRFPEPMDRGLLDRLIAVIDAGGNSVMGRIEIDAGETRWRFFPDVPWRAGAYELVVGTELEDLAGNALNGLFEVDVFEVDDASVTETESIPFTIEP